MQGLLWVGLVLGLLCALVMESSAVKEEPKWPLTVEEMKDPKLLKSVANKRKKHYPKGFSRTGVPIQVRETDIETCPDNDDHSCDNLEDPCYTECGGTAQFNRKSCKGCEYYLACAAGGIPFIMPCPVGLHWNSAYGICDWPWSANCVPCAETSSLAVDFEHNIIPDGDLTIMWEHRPLPGSYPACDASGIIKVHPPSCAKVVNIHMKIFYLGIPLFHIAGHRNADGMGDYFGDAYFGPTDWEMHSSLGTFYAFTSMTGEYQHTHAFMTSPPFGQYQDLCIQIKPKEVSLSGGPNMTMTHDYLFADLDTMYIAWNRNLAGDVIVTSQGVCSMRVEWSC